MEIEWLILADYAQAIQNKLYLQGGGWTNFTVNEIPLNHQIGIATSVIVPWNETNQEANLHLQIQSEDGEFVGELKGSFKVGRPPDHPPGQEQRAQIAANIPIAIKKLGTYVIIASLEGQEQRRITFNVVEGPMLKMKRQQEAAQQPPPTEKPSQEEDVENK